jgi:hypothetical protein
MVAVLSRKSRQLSSARLVLSSDCPRNSGGRANSGAEGEGGVVLVAGKRLAVFSIRENKGGSVWVRAGSAFVNKDGSLNLLLDVLPLDGKLHVREAGEKKDGATAAKKNGEASSEAPSAGAHP